MLCIFAVIMYFVVREIRDSEKAENGRTVLSGNISKVLPKDEQRADTLIIGVSSAPIDVHPYTYDGENAKYLKKLVYQPLIEVSEKAETKYLNAREIVFSADGLSAQVRLAEGRKFSNGDDLTAERVKSSYELLAGTDNEYSSQLALIDEITVLDEERLNFTFKKADIRAIEVFELPLLHKDEESGAVTGTGPYQAAIAPYSDTVLTPNTFSHEKRVYGEIILRSFSYGDIAGECERQSTDIFEINKDTDREILEENGAYDVIEGQKDSGYFLLLNSGSGELRNAIAGAVNGREFFKRSQAYGIYPDGIVSAYLSGGRSQPSAGGFGEVETLSVFCGYDPISQSVYRELSAELEKKGIKAVKVADDAGADSSACDIVIYYGDYKTLINEKDAGNFYIGCSGLDAKDFYKSLEEYLETKNFLVPLQRDTKWTAILAGIDRAGLFD